MIRKRNPAIWWSARVIGALYTAAAAVIGLVAFIRQLPSTADPFAYTYLAIALLGFILLAVAWKWQAAGGVLYVLLAILVFFAITLLEALDHAGKDFTFLPSSIWSLPPLVTGILFFVGRLIRASKSEAEKGGTV